MEFVKNPDLIFTFNDKKIVRFDPLYRDSDTSIIIKEELETSTPGVTISFVASLVARYEPTRCYWWDEIADGETAKWPQPRLGLYAQAGTRYIMLGNGFSDPNMIKHGHGQTVRMEMKTPKELYETLGVNVAKQQFYLPGDPIVFNKVIEINGFLKKIYKRITDLSINEYLKHPDRDIKEINNKWCKFFKNMTRLQVSEYFVENKEKLAMAFHPLIKKFYDKQGWEFKRSALETTPLLTVQGGIGNHGEVQPLFHDFGMTISGWATPFLLVQEATFTRIPA